MRNFCFFTICFLFCHTAFADGKQLYNHCKQALAISSGANPSKGEHVNAGYCIGFIGGIADLNTLIKSGGGKGLFCIPSSNDMEAKIKTVMNYIDKNPNTNKDPDVGVVLKAFIAAHPCSTEITGN